MTAQEDFPSHAQEELSVVPASGEGAPRAGNGNLPEPLRWQYVTPDEQGVYQRCLDCGGEVWVLEDAFICSSCGRQEAP